MSKPRVNMTPWRKTKDEIIAIALRKGWFSVPRYLYRAEGLTKKCSELVKEGRLKRDPHHDQADSKNVVYVPLTKEPQT